MIGRLLGLVGALSMLLAAVPAAEAVAAPEGPRLAFLRASERPSALVVETSDAALRDRVTVAGGGIRVRPLPYPFSGPAWSPDGSLIAFSGLIGTIRTISRPWSRRLFVVAADGTGIHPIPSTRGGFSPVFSPDGRTIAFAKTVNRLRPTLFDRGAWKGTAVWAVRPDGTGLRQVTEWRNGVEDLPSSFSADGSTLALTHRDVLRDRADAVALRLDGSGSQVLAESAAWPRYSSDGSRIAYLGIRRVGDPSCCELGDGFSVDLFVMNADRSVRRQLTDTPGKAERPPSWDPSGERLAYTTRSSPTESASGDLEASVMQINADGTCRSRISVAARRLAGSHAWLYNPAWQPGPGREAGRIEC